MHHASTGSTQSLTREESQDSRESGARYIHNVPVLTGKHLELFWEKVDKSGDCWRWTGAKFTSGYGQVRYQKKNFGAHRLSYAMKYGSVPNGLIVCHKCDNPSCVNPEHLFAGTYKDNVQDMISKGRKSDCAGEANGQSKLSRQEIKDIRKEYSVGDITHKELAKKYGVSSALIGLITQGKVWENESGPRTNGMMIRDLRPSKIKGENNPTSKLTEKEVVEIRERYGSGGITMRQVGELYGICPQVVCDIVHRKAWKHVA